MEFCPDRFSIYVNCKIKQKKGFKQKNIHLPPFFKMKAVAINKYYNDLITKN